MPRCPWRQHQVVRLDVAVDHPLLVGVLQAQRRLVDELAGVGHRQRAPRLHQLGQVGPLDVLHREDQQVAHLHRRVGSDHVGMVEPGRRADLAEEAVERPLRSSIALFRTLSTSSRSISVLRAR